MKQGVKVILLSAFFIVLFVSKISAQNKPVNRNATPEARALLEYLYSISGKKILSGAHNGSRNMDQWHNYVEELTGKSPAVWGSDFGNYYREGNPEAIVKESTKRHKDGYIVTLMWHTGRPQDDPPFEWKTSTQGEMSDQDWIDLTTPGTAIHNKWIERVDTIAIYLKQLQDLNIPVLWRPYHEMNGIWFWWGDKKGEDGFAKLWKMMYDRYTNHHQLNNLIWVWNTNTPRDRENDEAYAYELYFPGLEYVDVLAADVYHNDYRQEHHDQLLELAEGKLISLGEVGEMPTPEILDSQPMWAWFMVWSKWVETHNTPQKVKDLYSYPRTLSHGEFKVENSTIDPQATKETINLFNNLREVSRDHILFGHQDDPAYGIGWAYEPGKSDCKITAGSYPAVYGWELGGLELGHKKNLDDVPFDTMRDLIVESYLRGGVTTISWHEYSPVSGKDSWADTRDTVNKTVESIIPGGTHHKVYKEHLDKVAHFLNSLKTGDGTRVPVIFRPLHENTGSWFWWGEKHCSELEYKALFQFTVQYLKEEHQLHHLLYCYSPSGDFNSEEDYLKRYPGDDYVDILGFDQYRIKSNDKSGEGAVLRMGILADMAMERNKLYALTETGDYGLKTENWFTHHLLPIINADDKTRGITYVLVWRNEERQVDHFFVPYKGHEQTGDFRKFRDTDLILFEEDLPANLYR